MFTYAQSVEPTATPAGEFTDGNPVAGLARTLMRSFWPNMIQRELLAVLTAAGVAPDEATFNQVVTAIQSLINAAQLSAITTAQSYVDHLPFGMIIGEVKQLPVNPGVADTFAIGANTFAELKGQLFSRSTYAAAFAFAQTYYLFDVEANRVANPGRFTTGDLSTTWRLPNMPDLFVRHPGTNSAPIGVLQGDAIRNITGQLRGAALSGQGGVFASAGSVGGYGGSAGTAGNVNMDISGEVPTADENRPANVAWPWIIRLV